MTRNITLEPKAPPTQALTITADASLRAQLYGLLSGVSIHAILKESAQLAVHHLRVERPPQLIILDWMLPQNLAPRFLQELRGSDRFATLPVLVIVQDPDPQAIKAAFQSGANRYLTQSFLQSSLIRTLREMHVKVF